jgi:hypothetical protein
VTTGPDGQPIHDESSQQSTLSQSSDNSGGRQTPKGGYSQVRRTEIQILKHYAGSPRKKSLESGSVPGQIVKP